MDKLPLLERAFFCFFLPFINCHFEAVAGAFRGIVKVLVHLSFDLACVQLCCGCLNKIGVRLAIFRLVATKKTCLWWFHKRQIQAKL